MVIIYVLFSLVAASVVPIVLEMKTLKKMWIMQLQMNSMQILRKINCTYSESEALQTRNKLLECGAGTKQSKWEKEDDSDR